MSNNRHSPWYGRLLVAGSALFAIWLVAGAFVGPYLVREAYEGHGPAFMMARMGGRTLPLGHYLQAWQKWYLSISTAAAVIGIGIVLVAVMTRPLFYRRVVHGASARDLAKIRIVTAGVLFVNSVWEDLASTAILPREFIRPMGVIDLLHGVPGFTSFAANAAALQVFQACVALLLLLAALGYRARITVPLSAIGAIVMGGLIRQYCHFFHTMAVPLLMLCVLSFSRCADALSLDARARRTRITDPFEPSYAWYYFAAIAVIALSYTAAGTSKLQNGGLMWWAGDNIKTYILTDALGNMHFDWGVGLALANIPSAYFAPFGVLALLGETLFVLVLVSEWARRIVPVVVLGMHTSIFFLQNVLFFDLIAILITLFVWPTLAEAYRVWRCRHIRVTRHEVAPLREDWTGKAQPLSVALSVFLASFFVVATLRVEYYPFSRFQMYSGRNTSSVIRYERVLAIRQSGTTERARLERGAWALADARWQDNLWMAFDNASKPLFQEYLNTISPRLSAQNPDDPIVRYVVERWEWDYSSEPVGPNPGRRVARVEFVARNTENSEL